MMYNKFMLSYEDPNNCINMILEEYDELALIIKNNFSSYIADNTFTLVGSIFIPIKIKVLDEFIYKLLEYILDNKYEYGFIMNYIESFNCFIDFKYLTKEYSEKYIIIKKILVELGLN